MTAKIKAKDFRVGPDDKVKLPGWPIKVDAYFEAKKQYHKQLEAPVFDLDGRAGKTRGTT